MRVQPKEIRWYDAVAGVGLEGLFEPIWDDDDGWHCLGLIIHQHGRYEVQVNRQEDTYTNAVEYTLEDARHTLLRLLGLSVSVSTEKVA